MLQTFYIDTLCTFLIMKSDPYIAFFIEETSCICYFIKLHTKISTDLL